MVGRSIEDNLYRVRNRIAAACQRCGRDLSEVQLVAVSKGQPAECVKQAVAAGQTQFGENYVKEALLKMKDVGGAEWHFIGTLQSNKVKQIVGQFTLIHSVDRMSVMDAIARRSEELNVIQAVLVEINLAEEASKAGLLFDQASDFLEKARDLRNIRVHGLMGLPPMGNAESSRPYFRKLRGLSRLIGDQCELSMGTSQDFEVAIEEGATLIRVGTDIFGPRIAKEEA
jgi:pyridoxal phosphate enzyme (YggS family)